MTRCYPPSSADRLALSPDSSITTSTPPFSASRSACGPMTPSVLNPLRPRMLASIEGLASAAASVCLSSPCRYAAPAAVVRIGRR